jgi:hypothetical protein
MTLEAVHLDEQLVERLLALFVAERGAAAAAPDGVELVDEDDAGAVALGFAEQLADADAPTPAYISTKSEPLANRNGTPASPAIERASSVLPVPGGPTSSTPFGIRPPTAENLSGSRRKSTISLTSSFASSTPATSWNVTTFAVRSASRARARNRGNLTGGRAIDGEPRAARRTRRRRRSRSS